MIANGEFMILMLETQTRRLLCSPVIYFITFTSPQQSTFFYKREAMRKFVAATVLLTLLVSAAVADTLYLKNGSVLKGTFIGYENGQFIFELSSGRRLTFRPAEVSRLVIERDIAGDERREPDRDGRILSRNPDPRGRWESFQPIDVRLADQWTRSPIQVSRGQRVRVEASGTIYLQGRTQTGPDGLSGRRDPDAPLPDENDGALVAAISQDPSSPPILIGRSHEFTADRDGVLYFTVNHWETRDARGAFRVNVSVDRNIEGGAIDTGQTPDRGRERTITVSANQPWTDTGIEVEPNMTFEIIAEGQIEIGNRNTSAPDGNRNAISSSSNLPVPDAGAGALIGKIRYRDGRDSNFVFIGARGTPASEPNEYGRLFLGINDDYFRDNRGSFKVRIRW